jgi:hypothetical protein
LAEYWSGFKHPSVAFFGDICCGVGQKDRSTLNCDTPQYYAFFAQVKIWGILGAISGQMLNICPEIALVEAYRGID